MATIRPSKHDKPISAVTRINQQLKAQGRAERLVRGRGYYYLTQGDVILPSSMICCMWIEPQDYDYAKAEVRDLLASGGVTVQFN